MRAIETVHAEPRDQLDEPGYRVNFWQPTPQGAWALDAYALLGAADVDEVLRWIEAKADGRRFELFAEVDTEAAGPFLQPRKAALVRLLGSNPNADDGRSVPMGAFVKPE